jgi:hypothetical protein
LPSQESSLQQNVILGQATIFPTLFDLMGLRWAPAVSDVDPLALSNAEFVVRNRRRELMNRVFDFSSSKVDEFLRVPPAERRTDLYRTQETIPAQHPNGYTGPGLNLRDGQLREGYGPRTFYPETRYIPRNNAEGAQYLPGVYGPTSPSLPPSPSSNMFPNSSNGTYVPDPFSNNGNVPLHNSVPGHNYNLNVPNNRLQHAPNMHIPNSSSNAVNHGPPVINTPPSGVMVPAPNNPLPQPTPAPVSLPPIGTPNTRKTPSVLRPAPLTPSIRSTLPMQPNSEAPR